MPRLCTCYNVNDEGRVIVERVLLQFQLVDAAKPVLAQEALD